MNPVGAHKGAQNYVTVGGLGGGGERVPTTREPDSVSFQLPANHPYLDIQGTWQLQTPSGVLSIQPARIDNGFVQALIQPTK